MSHLHSLTTTTARALLELQSQVDCLSFKLAEVIRWNQQGAMISVTEQSESTIIGDRPSPNFPVTRNVRLLLMLAGEEGTTSRAILRELAPCSDATPSAVRSALNRLRNDGHAHRVGYRWFPASGIGTIRPRTRKNAKAKG